MFSLAKILKQIQKYAKTNEEALAAVRKNIAARNKENPQSGPKYKFDRPKGGTEVAKRGGTEVAKRGSNAVAKRGSNAVAKRGSNAVAKRGSNAVAKRNSNAVTVPGGKGTSQKVKVDNVFTGLKMATLEDLTDRVNEYLKDGTPNTAAGVEAEIKKAKGLSKADANKLISILGPEIKDAADKKRSDSFKPAPAGPRPEKELTFGEKFNIERAKAKKAGKELTATFTYKGKSYHTRTEKEEDTRKEKASARTTGKGKKAITIMDLAPPRKRANRGALVSRQRKGHTDMRKGGLFR